ncbi:zeta toxin family protein [Campylobacter jejuni]|nr:zeta toxin family protein [Campylobacter jejuni]
MVNQPTATIFAGVNGAGKTTLYFLTQEQGINLGYRINVDEIAQSIGDHRDRQTQVRASKIAIKMRKVYINDKLNFNQETTLCGKAILNLFSELKEHGYKINLHFVGLDSPQTAKARVKIRVAKGGHDIEPHLIDKRYYESMQNLLKIMPLCDEILVYDNTKNYELIAKITNGILDLQNNVAWFSDLIPDKIQSKSHSYNNEYNHSSRIKL